MSIQHTFAQLKARFPFLTSVSIRVQDDENNRKVALWFLVACIVHNYLRDTQEEEWTLDEDVRRASEQEAGIRADR